jgi:exonuclease SbcC
MIPLRIEVKNFRAIPSADIDFSDITLAAVVGRNGAGKSSLFTGAPNFALFGETVSGSADDAVRAGETECAVTLAFEHQGSDYRVIRTRSKSVRGKSGLELQRRANDGDSGSKIGSFTWTSLSGATIRETQEKIERLIGLNAETFTSTSMIMQGRSNEFTAKAPGQRKAILGRILGLDMYEELREGAKKRAGDAEKKLFVLKEEISRLDEEIMSIRDAGMDTIAATENEIISKNMDVEHLESELRELQSALDGAAKTRDERREKTRAAEELRQRAQETADRAAGANEVIDRIDAFLSKEAELAEKARRNEEMKLLRAGLEGKIARHGQLKNDIAALSEEIISFESERDRLADKLSQIRQILERKPRYEEAAAEYAILEREAEQDARKSETASEIEAEINRREKERLNLSSDLKSNELLRRAAVEKAARLEKSGCVNLAAAEESPCAFLRDAIEAKRKLPALEAEEKELSAGMLKMETEIKEAKGTLELLGYSKSAAAARNERMKKLRPAVDKLPRFADEEERAAELAERVGSCAANIAGYSEKHKTLVDEIALLDKDLANVPNIEHEIAGTEAAVKELAEIPAHKERRNALVEKELDCEREHVNLLEKISAVERELESMPEPDTDELEEKIGGKAAILSISKRELNELHMKLGSLKKAQEDAQNSTAKIKELESERKPLARSLVRWQTLERAFSRNGIPALIIENAVPELERISNEILGQMSNGEHNLRFETQRELKSKDGIAETLDIIVSDWHGERPYETLSGGEASRVDLAIRIAISELLANRAGNKIEWLTMDETFSNQDAEHKELVIKSIKRVSDRFKKVIVITHDESLLGAFPQVINLSKDDAGLEVLVA